MTTKLEKFITRGLDNPYAKFYFCLSLFMLWFLVVAASIVVVMSAHGASHFASTISWNLYNTSGKIVGSTSPSGSDMATFTIPVNARATFLTTTSSAGLIGDLTSRTLTASVTITTTGNPTFTYGGEGSTINPCQRAANVRLYITTSIKPFNLTVSQNNEDGYWWSAVSDDLVNVVGNTVTITAPLTPDQWSNANGHTGTEHPAGFAATVANVRQIGLGYGGGCFFDVGVSVNAGTGTATFHLLDYTAQ